MSYAYSHKEEKIKRFTIDLGLLPGYDTSRKPHTQEEVVEWYLAWQKERLMRDKPYFSGMVTPNTVAYAFNEKGEMKAIAEPACRIEGEVNGEHNEDVFESEQKALEIIFELAQYIGNKAGQERMHVYYEGKYYVLKATETL